LIAVIFFAMIATAIVVWLAAKFYHRRTRTDFEVLSVKTDVAVVRTNLQAVATKAELKEEIAKLKENDFFHLGKAMLIGFSLLLKKEQEQGFERIKDCVLETTPDNRKEKIKSITL
jgi:iron-sulfur cluster repair protein YtfE (RIC family)